MRLIRQKATIPMRNYDVYLGAGLSKMSKHGPLLPDSIRCIVCGPSNCGKTNTVLNLLFSPNGLKFKNVYIFSKSLNQPKYSLLSQVLPKEVGYYAYDDNSSVIHPCEAKKYSIFIFDDIACEKHDNIRNYFTMGRHYNIDTFYLGQTYSHIPKQLIRDNANFIILFKQDDTNLKHIYTDHVNTDMPFERFKGLCSVAWKDSHGFLVIDKDGELNKGRYRVGFDQFVTDLGS